MRPERGPPSRPSRRTHVRVEPGAKPFVDDLLLGRGFVRSRAAPSLRSIESQPSTQGFVFCRLSFPAPPEAWGDRGRSQRGLLRRGLFSDGRVAGARSLRRWRRRPPVVPEIRRRSADVGLCPSPDGGLLRSFSRSSGEAPASAPRRRAFRSFLRRDPPIRALAKPRVCRARRRRRRWRRPRAMAGLEVLSPGCGGWGCERKEEPRPLSSRSARAPRPGARASLSLHPSSRGRVEKGGLAAPRAPSLRRPPLARRGAAARPSGKAEEGGRAFFSPPPPLLLQRTGVDQ